MQTRYLTLITLILLTLSTLQAQVGVNNPSPEQALDVAGKVKVSDDATAPSDGTIRYNSPEGAFEGYSEGEWQAFNKSAAPDEPVPFTATVYTTFQADEYQTMEYQSTLGAAVLFGLNGFASDNGNRRTVVPAGYTMVVDYIHVMGMSKTSDEIFYVQITHTDGDAASQTDLGNLRDEPLIFVTGSVKAGPSVVGNGRAPVLIVDEGEQLVVRNESDPTSTGGVRVVMNGFLVRDLDQYFTY